MPYRRPAQTPSWIFRDLARLHVRAQRATIGCQNASVTQCTILTELGRAPSLSLGELAARLRLDKGWVSRAIEDLVKRGTVLRVTHPTDRRAIVLTLSRAGQARFRSLERVLNAQIERVFDRLGPQDRPKVAHALALLHEVYLEETGEAGNGTDDDDTSACA